MSFTFYGDCLYGEGLYKGRPLPQPVYYDSDYRFTWLPDWGKPVTISLTYNTVIYETETKKEYRRPLLLSPLFEQKAMFTFFNKESAFSFLRWLEIKHSSVIAFPDFTKMPIWSVGYTGYVIDKQIEEITGAIISVTLTFKEVPDAINLT